MRRRCPSCCVCCWPAAGRSTGSEVVVYTALDSEFSTPIFAQVHGGQTDIAVLPKFDTESTKTVGLAEAIVAESDRPRCDVFWNNEILQHLAAEAAGAAGSLRAPDGQAAIRPRIAIAEGLLARLRGPGAGC